MDCLDKINFAWDLWTAVSSTTTKTENLLVSPLGILSAFTLFLLGPLNDDSLHEIKRALHVHFCTPEIPQLSQDLSHYFQQVKGSVPTWIERAGLFIQHSHEFAEHFQETNFTIPNHPFIQSVDFNWPRYVAAVIQGRMYNSLVAVSDKDLITVQNSILLASNEMAKYLSADYGFRFIEAYFFRPKRAPKIVQAMLTQDTFYHHQGAVATIVAIPIERNGNHHLVIALPHKMLTLHQVEAALDAASIQQMMNDMRPRLMNISMPRFQLRSVVKLQEALRKLGVNNIFENKDLRFGTNANAFLDDVIQFSRINVDDQVGHSLEPRKQFSNQTDKPLLYYSNELLWLDVNINRAFLFWTWHKPTKSILFIGRMTDPSL